MYFYDLSKEAREKLVQKIHNEILAEIPSGKKVKTEKYFSDEDTYIRKAAYQSIGKIYNSEPLLRGKIISLFETLMKLDNGKVRQTTVNSAGEIGIYDFKAV